jgi:hypothetical protein
MGHALRTGSRWGLNKNAVWQTAQSFKEHAVFEKQRSVHRMPRPLVS